LPPTFRKSLHVLFFSERSFPESELLYDWRFTAHQFVLATSPLRLTSSNFFRLNAYVTSSLTRGLACRLQLLLVLAGAVILRSSPAGPMTTFYCFKFETPPTWKPGPRIYIPQEQGSPVTPPRTGFPLRCLLRLTGLRWKCHISMHTAV
jgi:hypothetical protein